ncbi:MAG: aspartate/glutamate racemase family protein [Bryobacteraceae bacterium]
MRKLGWVGGLGPGATVHYYRELVKRRAGEAVMIHADMAHGLKLVQAGDRQGLADYFARLMERLAGAGAEVAAISAVTPHFCIRELEKITPLPLVNIIAEVSREIAQRGYGRVALFGTRYTVESRMFGLLEGVEVMTPSAAQVDVIHDAYMSIVNEREEGAAETLSRIAAELPVDAVVLAGTDLSLVFHEGNINFPHVDATVVHLDAIMRELNSAAEV